MIVVEREYNKAVKEWSSNLLQPETTMAKDKTTAVAARAGRFRPAPAHNTRWRTSINSKKKQQMNFKGY